MIRGLRIHSAILGGSRIYGPVGLSYFQLRAAGRARCRAMHNLIAPLTPASYNSLRRYKIE